MPTNKPTPRTTGTVMLPALRLEQLRSLARIEGKTITGVIESLIQNAIAAGRLPDALPGYSADASDGFVRFTIPGFTFAPVAPARAVFIAEKIEKPPAGPGCGLEIMDAVLAVGRLGKGFGIAAVRNGKTVAATSTTESVMGDLARLIRKAAARAEEQRRAAH